MRYPIIAMFLSLIFINISFSEVRAENPGTAAITAQASDKETQVNKENKDPKMAKADGAEKEKTADKGEKVNTELKLDLIEDKQVTNTISNLDEEYRNIIKKLGISSGLVINLLATLLLIGVFFLIRMIGHYGIKLAYNAVMKFQDSFDISRRRVNFYRQNLNFITTVFLFSITAFVGLRIWDIELEWFSSEVLFSIISGLISFIVVAALGILIIELSSGYIEGYFKRNNASAARIDTIKPITKRTVLGFLFLVFSMLALTQLGIDILPLLAGAGVLGIAIGFGAQALVKDVISGFIIIMEDLIQIGDIVKLEGRMGTVERISIRKIQLRSIDGVVYTIPFGEISIVENYTKVFSYYLFEVGVAYKENTDEVKALLEAIGKELREDEGFKDFIMDDLEILGVDRFADSAVVLKARIKTVPKKQWAVGREFNRRMKIEFDKQGIEIPFPHQTIFFAEDKDGHAATSLNVRNTSKADNDDARGEAELSEGKSSPSKTKKPKNSEKEKESTPTDNEIENSDD